MLQSLISPLGDFLSHAKWIFLICDCMDIFITPGDTFLNQIHVSLAVIETLHLQVTCLTIKTNICICSCTTLGNLCHVESEMAVAHLISSQSRRNGYGIQANRFVFMCSAVCV